MPPRGVSEKSIHSWPLADLVCGETQGSSRYLFTKSSLAVVNGHESGTRVVRRFNLRDIGPNYHYL